MNDNTGQQDRESAKRELAARQNIIDAYRLALNLVVMVLDAMNDEHTTHHLRKVELDLLKRVVRRTLAEAGNEQEIPF